MGTGNVSVSYQPGYTGHNTVNYVVEFRGAKAGLDLSALKAWTSSGDIVMQVSTLRQGSAGYSVLQQARAIETALQASLGSGNVSVSYDTTSSLSQSRFQIQFAGGLAARDVGTLQAQVSGSGLSASMSTERDGRSAVGAVQTVCLYDEAVVGTFELSLWFQGRTYVSGALPFNATAAQVQSALLAAQNSTGQSLAQQGLEATVQLLTETRGSKVWQVAFGGAADSVDLDVMQGRITSTVPAPTPNSAPPASVSGTPGMKHTVATT